VRREFHFVKITARIFPLLLVPDVLAGCSKNCKK